jgi:hypothetical protein
LCGVAVNKGAAVIRRCRAAVRRITASVKVEAEDKGKVEAEDKVKEINMVLQS